jgi:hypothetical protein
MKYSRIVVIALAVLMRSNVMAQEVLVDEHFQSPFLVSGTAINTQFTNWTCQADKIRTRTITADIPGDTRYPGSDSNQVMQIENIGNADCDLSHSWSATDVYILSMNVSPQAWGLDTARWIRPKLYETDGDVLLWDPGENESTALPSETGYAWNGPGLYGNSTWQAEPDTLYTWTIEASTFSAGTPGKSIYLRVTQSGSRGVYFDNVKMTIAPPMGTIVNIK